MGTWNDEEVAIPFSWLAARVVDEKLSSGVEVAVSCASLELTGVKLELVDAKLGLTGVKLLEFVGVKVLAVAERPDAPTSPGRTLHKALMVSNADLAFGGLASAALAKVRGMPLLLKRPASGVYSVPTVVGDSTDSPE